jgi:hypothetical protein
MAANADTAETIGKRRTSTSARLGADQTTT